MDFSCPTPRSVAELVAHHPPCDRAWVAVLLVLLRPLERALTALRLTALCLAAPRHGAGDLAFKSTSGDAATDAAFVELLARAAAAPAPAASGAERPSAARVGKLRLADSDVAKVG